MAVTGRPSEYTQEIADEICARLAAGQSLRAITGIDRDDFMPGTTTVRRWLAGDEDWNLSFRLQYARAREDQADFYAEEIIEIADQPNKRTTADGEVIENDPQRDRLRVDARKWFASKLAPKKYGDKVQIDGTLDTTSRNINMEAVDVTDAARLYQELMARPGGGS